MANVKIDFKNVILAYNDSTFKLHVVRIVDGALIDLGEIVF